MKNIIYLIIVLLISSQNVLSVEESRIALLIGNQGYQKGRLDNPHNDVDDMEMALEAVGFKVRKLKEQSLWEMKQAILGFGKSLQEDKNTVGLFYFSGHGMQYKGKNYLFPIGAMESVAMPEHLSLETLNAEYLLATMDGSDNRLNLVFLDACRDNNFTKGWFKGTGLEGLAPMQAPSGSLIGYATRANHPASAGKGQRNSPYVQYLKQEIVKPGISVFEMLTNVRVAVKSSTNGEQEPEFYSGLDGKFCFGGCKQGTYSLGRKTGKTEAQEIWDDLDKDCTDSDKFLEFMEKRIDRIKIKSKDNKYYDGYIYGTKNILATVMEHCIQKCTEVGRVSGEISASIFCSISKAIGRTAIFRGGENLPNITCGEPYRTSCESTFYSQAKKECPYYAKGSDFEKYYKGSCSYNPNPN